MEDYSSNEKVKHEKQRRNMYILFWSVCICIYIVIYVLRNLAIYKICYFSHLALKLFLEMHILYDRYLPLEEALSLELESYPQ